MGSRGEIRVGDVREVLAGVADERMLYLRYSTFRSDRLQQIEAGEVPDGIEPTLRQGLQEATGSVVGDIGDRTAEAWISPPVLVNQTPAHAVAVISAPVVSGGRFRGVLSAVVDLQPIWQSIVTRNRTGHSVYALDPNGKVFASTDPVRYRPGFHYSSPLVERFLSAEGRTAETMPFESEDLPDEGPQSYIGSFEKTRQDWGVFVLARSLDVYLPVQSLIASSLNWALAALLLAAICSVFFARTLSNPINRLAAATRAFARGDFSPRVVVRSRNEIGELGETFNHMAQEIEDHIRRLQDAAEENHELFLGTIRALAQAIDAKDPYTRGHSIRVNRYSVIIARHLGLDEDEVRDIHVSSLLHDVGKIGIDDAVLKKPGRLTDAEFEIIKRHPVLGAEIMAPIRSMNRIIPGLRWHHERFAGGGYPDGLIGEQIPLMARIIAVADTFDAMTTHRPYQTAMTFAQALHRINEVLCGTNLDPQVVAAFNTACELGRINPQAEIESTMQADVEAIQA